MDTNDIKDAVIVSSTESVAEEGGIKRKYVIAFLLGIITAIGGYILYERLYGDVAAIVNGTRITMSEYEENIDMMNRSAGLQGIDTNDDAVKKEIETQALTNLINNELLVGAARRSGTVPDEAKVTESYDALVEQMGGEAELTARMGEVGITKDILMSNIRDRVIVDAYIEAETDIESLTISDDDVTNYVNNLTESGVTLPSLDEIRPQIEASILAEKQQDIVNGLIEKLRSEADITVRIPGYEAPQTEAPQS